MAASEYEMIFDEYSKEGDPRFLFANYTSGLLIVNSTLLAVAAAGLLGLAGNGHKVKDSVTLLAPEDQWKYIAIFQV